LITPDRFHPQAIKQAISPTSCRTIDANGLLIFIGAISMIASGVPSEYQKKSLNLLILVH